MQEYLEGEGFRVMTAADEASAWQIAQVHRPNIAILDIIIPAQSGDPTPGRHPFGIRLGKCLKQQWPNVGVVFLSAYDHLNDVAQLLAQGIIGLAYLPKGCQPDALLVAIKAVVAGHVMIDSRVTELAVFTKNLLDNLMPEERLWVEQTITALSTLTTQERNVMRQIAAAHNRKGIAQKLNLKPKTVDSYIFRAYNKLGLHNMDTDSAFRNAVIVAKAYMIYDLQNQSQGFSK
ncbi:MAG: response regulator transcription factor [Chloroflexi bacterium]|nr:response regulator transcription factor [Chloroflexota bacterium]